MASKTIGLASLKKILVFIAFIMAIFSYGKTYAQSKDLIVRIARLQIDPAQLESYNAALKEHAETAVRVEPGVISLYAVAEKGNPTHITVFEIYASAAAYQAHLKAPHFLKYKNTTKDMVKSLELMETDPIVFAAKPKL